MRKGQMCSRSTIPSKFAKFAANLLNLRILDPALLHAYCMNNVPEYAISRLKKLKFSGERHSSLLKPQPLKHSNPENKIPFRVQARSKNPG